MVGLEVVEVTPLMTLLLHPRRVTAMTVAVAVAAVAAVLTTATTAVMARMATLAGVAKGEAMVVDSAHNSDDYCRE